jgi:hypothetical protein
VIVDEPDQILHQIAKGRSCRELRQDDKELTEFTSGQIFAFTFSRDGKQIALARGSITSDVVLITGFRRPR